MVAVLRDFTARYHPVESWLYDRVVAPAVLTFAPAFEARLAARARAGGEVLEVGSGGGQLAAWAAGRHPNVRWTGLDLSPEQVARARRRARAWADRVRFVEGSALDLPFADGSFDAVISVASIKHWPDPARGLGECARVLRSGGLLLVAEADRGCRHEDARSFVTRWAVPPPARALALAFFRTFVAGRSLDLDEARALLASLPVDGTVERVPGTPALLISGTRR
jgi:ubiquinone/menaquinone biosynthesis C-methylase UbiE